MEAFKQEFKERLGKALGIDIGRVVISVVKAGPKKVAVGKNEFGVDGGDGFNWPNLDQAREHRNDVFPRSFDGKNKKLKLFGDKPNIDFADTETMGLIGGVGLRVYFEFLEAFAKLFFFLGCLSMPCIMLNYTGSGLDGMQAPGLQSDFGKTTFGNLYPPSVNVTGRIRDCEEFENQKCCAEEVTGVMLGMGDDVSGCAQNVQALLYGLYCNASFWTPEKDKFNICDDLCQRVYSACDGVDVMVPDSSILRRRVESESAEQSRRRMQVQESCSPTGACSSRSADAGCELAVAGVTEVVGTAGLPTGCAFTTGTVGACTVATCTGVGVPYAGCTVPACTTDAVTPYDGCDTSCTGVDAPHVGCTALPCTAADTPYAGCLCTGDATPQGASLACTQQTCTAGEVVADCATGYIAGTAAVPSTTCPVTVCTQVDAALATCSGTATDTAVTCSGLALDATCSGEAGCTLNPATSETCTDTVEGPAYLPYVGCIVPTCTGVDLPYVGCDTTCTGMDLPYAGCTAQPCTAVDTPYAGCVCFRDATPAGSLVTCTQASCTAVELPYAGCTVPACTGVELPYAGCTALACTGVDLPYVECLCTGNATPAGSSVACTQQTCTAGEVVADCATGYTAGDVSTPSTTCPPA